MSIHILTFIIILICAVGFFCIKKVSSEKSAMNYMAGLATLVFLLSVGYFFASRSLADKVVYREFDKVKIFVNQADQEYYFKHDGKVLKMLDECGTQYPHKVPPSRVNSIPEITVYEKSYIPVMGVYYIRSKEFIYVHGHDARIDQSIELK